MKLHPAWRIVIYLLACVVLTFGLRWFGSRVGLSDPFLPAFLGFTIVTWLAREHLDQARFVDLGLCPRTQTRLDLAVGLGLPLVLLVWVFALEWAAGWLLVAGVRPAGPGDAVLLWQLAMVAWYEELFARGYVLQTLALFTGFPVANVIAAIIFAGFHLANPGVTPMALLGIFLAGILLGVCFRVTRSLYLPMAFHFSWNLTQALLGYPVSGTSFAGLLHLVREGPPLYTGGAFGPEAGLFGFFVMLVAIGTVWEYGKWRRRNMERP